MDFVGKTSLMIAYERQLESEKPEGERLFCDPLAKYFTGGGTGKRVSDFLACGLKVVFDPTGELGFKFDGHVRYTAARTQLINDYVARWIKTTAGKK